jgi:hypothetical protein
MSLVITNLISESISTELDKDSFLIGIRKRLAFHDGEINKSSTQRGPLGPNNSQCSVVD